MKPARSSSGVGGGPGPFRVVVGRIIVNVENHLPGIEPGQPVQGGFEQAPPEPLAQKAGSTPSHDSTPTLLIGLPMGGVRISDCLWPTVPVSGTDG